MLAAAAVLVSVASSCTYELRELTPELPESAQSSVIYAADGTPILTLHAEENRTDLTLAEIPVSLQQAVISFPGDPQTWYRLAAFQLGTLDAPETAIKTIRGALYLDPHSQPASQLFLTARARQREKTAQATPG